MKGFSNAEKRNYKITAFGNGFKRLSALLDSMEEVAFTFRSKRDVWNISEMVIHLADLEAAAYVNFRRAVAEPTESILAFDKDLWAESLPYYNQPVSASLKLFRLLRTSNYLLLKNISGDVWLQTVHYPDNGQISLEDLLDLYSNHFEKVITGIQQNLVEWKQWQAV